MALQSKIYTDSIICNKRVGCAGRTIANVDIDRSCTSPCHFDWSKSLEMLVILKKQQTLFVVKGFCGMEKSRARGNKSLNGVISQCVRCLHSAQLIVGLLHAAPQALSECAPVGMTNGVQWGFLSGVGVRTGQEHIRCASRIRSNFI
jgi:hypothetical protein